MVIAFVFLLFFTYIGVWLLLQHYHEHVLVPFMVNIGNQIYQRHMIAAEAYHEDKLLPSLSLLASQKAVVETNPVQVEEPPQPRRPQPLTDQAQIDKIWAQVSASQ